MFIERIYERGLAQASYLVACQQTGEAIVIDPRRDIEVYEKIAEREGFRISFVTETHVHADYLSGTPELARATGATVMLSAEGGSDWRYSMRHEPLRGGDSFSIGKIKFDVRHTPGHTPEHIVFILTDTATSERPRMAFTGDFLFVGDVGRPDLLDESAGMTGTREIGARDMFRSLRSFDDLPDELIIWPGHGAGSACGKALGAVPVTTLGYERATNPAFAHAAESSFVEWLLDGQPEAPRYFGEMKRLNVTRTIDAAHPLERVLDRIGTLSARSIPSTVGHVVDVRDAEAFAVSHLPGSINIPLADDMATWAGTFLSYDEDFVVVGSDDEAARAIGILYRIGLDRCVGRVDPESLPDSAARTIHNASPAALPEIIAEGTRIVDVRSRSEFLDSHLPEAEHRFLGTLSLTEPIGDPDAPLLVHCRSGYRSSIAASILVAAGHRRILNLEGGYDAILST